MTINEQKAEGKNSSQHIVNAVLPAVRPSMASEALQLLKEGKTVEMPNDKVMDFLRWTEKAERNISFSCCFNGHNVGFCILFKA